MYDGIVKLYQKIILIFYSCFSLSSHDLSLCLSLSLTHFPLFLPLLYNQRSSTVIINLWVSSNGAPRIIHCDHSPWSSTIDRIGGVVEKHQTTNEERDERGRQRVKTVWVWVFSLWFHLGFFFFFLVFGHVNCTCWLGFFFFAWFSALNFDWLD